MREHMSECLRDKLQMAPETHHPDSACVDTAVLPMSQGAICWRTGRIPTGGQE